MSKVIKGINDLQTKNPELAKEWHPTKNGNIKPDDVAIGSIKNYWWLLHYKDEKTGKIFHFEWEDSPNHRRYGVGCPYLSGHKVYIGFNDLVTVNPKLAKEWHPTKNGNLRPTDVTSGSGKKVWWLLSYYDENKKKYFDLEWKDTITHRHNGVGCPFLNGKAVLQGFNDLATLNPNLAKQWHPTKNGNLKPTDVTIGSSKKVWWLLPYDDEKTGEHFDFEWIAKVSDRSKGNGCPYFSSNQGAVWQGFNDLATTNPELVKEWHPTKNGDLKPTNVTAKSSLKVWWLLHYDDKETGKHYAFEWQASIVNRSKGNKCPFLNGKAVWKGFNDLATTNPKLAKQWHPTKNGNLKPTDVVSFSNKKVWWLLPYDDPKTKEHFNYEWQASIVNRSKGNGCPYINIPKTEYLILMFLRDRDIKFKMEKSFPDCKDKRRLLFDIYLPNENIIIECDGMQHFKPIEHFGGLDYFQQLQKRDNIKNKYCKEKDIDLLRVPYIYDSINNKTLIENFVNMFLKTKKIPVQILEFYSNYNFNNYYKLFSV